MKKENKLTPNYLSKSFALAETNLKGAIMREGSGKVYLRNRRHLKKYIKDLDGKKEMVCVPF